MIKRFQQTINVQCYSPQTKKSYSYHIKRYISYYGEHPRQETIIRHLNYLKNQGYSPESLNIAKYSLIYYFEKILNQPITIHIPKIKRKKSLPKVVSKQDIIRLIQATTNPKHRIIIEMLYSSGLRLAELAVLRWADINLVEKSVMVREGKGRKDRLSILSDIVIQHLLDHQNTCPKNNPYIFFSEFNRESHITRKTIQKVLETSSRKANLRQKVTPHMLRHSFATHCLENGTDIRYIQRLLGHSDPKTTMIYTKVANKELMKIRSPLDITYQEQGVKTTKWS